MSKNANLILILGSAVVCLSLCLTEGKAAQTFTLSAMLKGTGHGTVTSSPAGIHCGASCSAVFNSGRKVTLTAKADSKSYFAGWSGGTCSGKGSCIVNMDSDVSVTADFEVQTPSISILPDVLDFGDVEIGEKASHVLQIGNTGTGPLKVTVSVQEDNEFRVNMRTFTVNPQKSRNIKFTFKPTAAGVQKALETGSMWLSPIDRTGLEDGSTAPWPLDETRDASEAPAAGASRAVNAQASIASNDSANPDLIVPLTALVQYPTKTCTLIIKYRTQYQSASEQWTYNEDATIPLTVTDHQKPGYPPSWVIDCNNTGNYLGWNCNGDSTWTESGTATFPQDASCQQCTWSGNGGNNYDLTGTMQNGQLSLTLNPTNPDGQLTANCCGNSTTWPVPPIMTGKRTVEIPFRPGGCLSKNVNSDGLTGTMSWCLQF
jgi:hypothetical protein